MAIDLCIESAGWVAQFVEASVVHPILPLRRSVSRVAQTSTVEHHEPDDRSATVAVIREAASDLPIDQAKALWLIDVCGCGYDEAAETLGVDRAELAGRIGDARRAIRHSITTPVR